MIGVLSKGWTWTGFTMRAPLWFLDHKFMLSDRSLNHTPSVPNYLSQNSIRPELLVTEMDVLQRVIRDGGSMFLFLQKKNLACKLISVCLNKDPVKLVSFCGWN